MSKIKQGPDSQVSLNDENLAPSAANLMEQLKRAQDQQIAMEEESIDQMLNQLDKGGPDWAALDPSLFAQIFRIVKEYHQETYSPRKALLSGTVKENIRRILSQSAQFKTLPQEHRDNLVNLLTQGLVANSQKIKLALYSELIPNSSVKSTVAVDLIRQIRNSFENIKQLAIENQDLDRVAESASQFRSLEEFNAVRSNVIKKIKMKAGISPYIMDQIIDCVEAYRNSIRNKNSGLTTPGMIKAMEDFRQAISQDPVLRELPDTEKYKLSRRLEFMKSETHIVLALAHAKRSSDPELASLIEELIRLMAIESSLQRYNLLNSLMMGRSAQP